MKADGIPEKRTATYSNCFGSPILYAPLLAKFVVENTYLEISLPSASNITSLSPLGPNIDTFYFRLRPQ